MRIGDLIDTVSAMKMLFPSLKESTIRSMSCLYQAKFRNIITSGIEEFQLQRGSINDEIYIVLNIVKSDPDFFLVDDRSSYEAMKRYDSIKTILNNIQDKHRKALLPKDESFCKYCLNFQEYISVKPEAPAPMSAPKSIVLSPVKLDIFKTSIPGCLNPLDCAMKLNLAKFKWIVRKGAWSAFPEIQSKVCRKFWIDGLNMFTIKNLFWGNPRKQLPEKIFELKNYVTNIDLASCHWSGFHGLLTYELSSSGLRLYILRIFSMNMKLAKRIVLDPMFNVLNTSTHAIEFFKLEFLRVKPADGSPRVTLACIARNIHLLVVEVGGGRRVTRYSNEISSNISLSKPLADNHFLLGYENFMLQHLYFSGAYHPELFMKIWLPDVPIASCYIGEDMYALTFRDMLKVATITISEKKVTLYSNDDLSTNDYTEACNFTFTSVPCQAVRKMEANLNERDRHDPHRFEEEGERAVEIAEGLPCTVVSLAFLLE